MDRGEEEEDGDSLVDLISGRGSAGGKKKKKGGGERGSLREGQGGDV